MASKAEEAEPNGFESDGDEATQAEEEVDGLGHAAVVEPADDGTSRPSMSSAPLDSEALIDGFLFKLGAVRKNWKLRYMVLRQDGNLYYFKKQPNPFDAAEAQGMVKIQSDVVELFLWDETIKKNMIKWPSSASPRSGFALKSRHGRVYALYAGSEMEALRWLAAMKYIGANMRFTDETKALLDQNAEEMDSWLQERLAAIKLAKKQESDGKDGGTNEEGELYVHKVVGGMVIKTENKKT